MFLNLNSIFSGFSWIWKIRDFPFVFESKVCTLKMENKLISFFVLFFFFLVKSISKVLNAMNRKKCTFVYSLFMFTDNFQFFWLRELHVHIWWIESERWWFIKGKRIKSREVKKKNQEFRVRNSKFDVKWAISRHIKYKIKRDWKIKIPVLYLSILHRLFRSQLVNFSVFHLILSFIFSSLLVSMNWHIIIYHLSLTSGK